MVHLLISDAGIQMSAGSEAVLLYQTRDDYEHLLARRGDNAAVKVLYRARTQEIRMMAPPPRHGNHSATLADLVQSLMRHLELEWQGFDPIDLNSDPPPDLAIEVDATSPTQTQDYEPLGVPELWIYRNGVLQIYLLRSGTYHESPCSSIFPDVPIREWFPEFVQRSWSAGASTVLREFEAKLRAQIPVPPIRHEGK